VNEVDAMTRLLDAENECVHGSLPADPVMSCACWPPERVAGLFGQDALVREDHEDDPAGPAQVIALPRRRANHVRRAA
jgi:hypothetical protein